MAFISRWNSHYVHVSHLRQNIFTAHYITAVTQSIWWCYRMANVYL